MSGAVRGDLGKSWFNSRPVINEFMERLPNTLALAFSALAITIVIGLTFGTLAAVEQNKPAIPKLSHLRESGSIEQDADVVMFIYRKSADRNYDFNSLTEEEKHSAEIHIAKHRNGPTGTVNLYFDGNTVSFKNLERGYN